MSKQAIMMAVDVGNQMDKPFSDDASRLKIAFECIKLTTQQKMFNNTSHEIGLTLFGDNQDDVLQLQPISKPVLEFVRQLQKIGNAKLDNMSPGGDIFKTIQFVIERIAEYTGTKKYNKRAFLFTSGFGRTDTQQAHLDHLVTLMNKYDVKFNVIALDFMESYNIQNNSLDGQVNLQPEQIRNANLLMKLRDREPDSFRIYPASIAIELYRQFRKRDVNPVALYRGKLEIAPGLDIDVATYKSIRREKLKSLAKYDATKEFNPQIQKEKDIITQTNYIVQGDKTGTLVEKENITNAYSYGPHLIPISQMLENGTRIFQEKNFKLLGFVEKDKVPREALMGEVDMVVPSDDPMSRKLFTSFVYSMLSLSKYAIARYVPRNNKKGVNPKLVVLIPFRSPEKETFYLCELPTAQDVRDYPFNGLKKSTEKQREIVSALIDKMNLVHRNGDQEIQELKVENTFNPLRQHFFQSIFHRALNPEGQLPDLDPAIRFYLKPEVRKFKETQDLCKELKKEFRLIKKELPKEKMLQKKLVLWKDILVTDDKQDSMSMISTDIDENRVVINKKFNLDDEEDKAINFANPIGSFRKMINNNREDLVNTAIDGMKNYIQGKSKTAASDEAINHIIECAKQMRKGCISEKQYAAWDNWFETCRSAVGAKVYERIKQEGLGFIQKSNEEVYKAEQLHPLNVVEVDDLD